MAQLRGERLQVEDASGNRVVLQITEHRGADDLLSAGLGLAGLRAVLAPPVSVAEISPALLRRRAVHANWRGIATLVRDDEVQAALAAPVSGRELHARVQLPGMAQPSRFLLQIPDHFDPRHPRLLVAPSSGSRGVYGAIALAGGWGLPRGWAVAYTDRGAGTDWFDVGSQTAPGLDGMPTEDPAEQLFAPAAEGWHGMPLDTVLTKHAHGQHHAEERWGDFIEHARDLAWRALERLLGPLPSQRISLAVGLSNGGGAVLRLLEQQHGFDGIVALAPNVHPPGGRAFPRYATEAAAWMSLAQPAPQLDDAPTPVTAEVIQRQAEAAHKQLRDLGWIRSGSSVAADAVRAYRLLRRRGWPKQTLAAARISTVFDFWSSALPTYLAAAGRMSAMQTADADTLGAHFERNPTQPAGTDADSNTVRRMLRWSDSAGIVPGADAVIRFARTPAATLERADALLRGQGEWGERVRRGVDGTRAGPIRCACPVVLVHGRSDGLIPSVFSSEPWVRARRSELPQLEVHWLEHTPHFDAFIAIPGYGDRLEPLLPHGYRALDRMVSALGG